MTPLSQEDRIAGGLEGLLIGDAFGVPYEFHAPGDLPAMHQLAFDPPDWFARAHGMVPPGTWSDDGAQALCLLESLLACGRLDVRDLGDRFVRWLDDGYLAVGGVVFDVGNTTRVALDNIRRGAPAANAGPTHERANGNGALMRVLPLALWHRGSDEELVRDAHAQTLVTHGHPRSAVCSALYCLWARYELDGTRAPYPTAVKTLRRLYAEDACHRSELDGEVRPDEPPQGRGTGYVLDCLHSARMVLASCTSYEEAIRQAVALGNDTDTTAAVAGGIAGVRFGLSGIPSDWREALRGRELLASSSEKLLRR